MCENGNPSDVQLRDPARAKASHLLLFNGTARTGNKGGDMKIQATQMYRPLLALVLMLIMSACSQGAPPPDPIDDQSSAVGIALKMRVGPLKITSEKPDVILFARLEEGETVDDVLTKEVLIPSTFVSGEQAYLLNAAPGTYVAVCALYAVENQSSDTETFSTDVGSGVSVGVSLDTFGGEDTYRNYFSKELIDRTKVTVGPRSFACMGRFVANQATFGNADEHQKHFLMVLEGKDDASNFLVDMFSSDHARCLTLHEAHTDEAAGKEFCKRAMNDLEGTAWVTMVGSDMAK